MKVVAFNGSSRKDGNTAILLRRVLAELEAEGIETELVAARPQALRGLHGVSQVRRDAGQPLLGAARTTA